MRKRHTGPAGIAALLVVCLAAIEARAAPIVYIGADPDVLPGDAHPLSDAAQAAFAAAAGDLQTITFEDAALFSIGGTLDANTTFSMINTGGSHGIRSDEHQLIGFNTTPGGDKFLRVAPTVNGPDASVTFSFATPIDAFGAYLTGMEAPLAGTVALAFDDGTAQTIDIAKNAVAGAQFVGFTDAGAAISSVSFHITGPFPTGIVDLWGIDDLQYSTVNAVPEPATLGLFAIGLAGAGLHKRRLRSLR